MFRSLRELWRLRGFKSKSTTVSAMKIKSRRFVESPVIIVGPVREFRHLGKGILNKECKGYLMFTQEEFDRAQARMIEHLEKHKK